MTNINSRKFVSHKGINELMYTDSC